MSDLRDKADALRRLHSGPRALLLPNAWDVASARLVEAAGFPAVATSSAGVAFALGYPDGQRISRAEMLEMVRRIAGAVKVPVTADVEAGYGTTAQAAAETARGVVEAGAVGMNFEDLADRAGLLPLELQVERIKAIRAAGDAAGVPLVLNARTDSFAVESIPAAQRADEAIRRANAYLRAGADCAFVPFVTDRDIIARLAREIGGPLNVLGVPGAPKLQELESLGVRRVSLGGGPARAAYGRARRVAMEVRETGSFEALRDAVTYAEMQRLLSG
ncbi:MAG TPA: isocitrate lyase/phosphoenolpyruvate mutase family protein [Myxococcales bacterium]|nr:isocitrate lyase/phosphoenolpyruvate mutase family protein [Myxococcales bacterium]